MRPATSALTAIVLPMLPAATAAAANPSSPALFDVAGGRSDARIWLAGYADDSTPGSHHGRHKRSNGATSKAIEPSHADLNGATRESADKAYRKQYGF